jgi:hypothetical protein
MQKKEKIIKGKRVRFHDYMQFVCRKSNLSKVEYEILGIESTV